MLSEGCIGGYCASTAQYQVYENCQMNTRAIARLIVLFTRSSHACGDDQIFRRGNYRRTLAIMARTNWRQLQQVIDAFSPLHSIRLNLFWRKRMQPDKNDIPTQSLVVFRDKSSGKETDYESCKLNGKRLKKFQKCNRFYFCSRSDIIAQVS